MNKWLLLFLLASPMVARAELVTPQFTQGSMNSTTTTLTQSLFEPIKKKVQKQLQAKVNKWKENRKKKRKDSSES